MTKSSGLGVWIFISYIISRMSRISRMSCLTTENVPDLQPWGHNIHSIGWKSIRHSWVCPDICEFHHNFYLKDHCGSWDFHHQHSLVSFPNHYTHSLTSGNWSSYHNEWNMHISWSSWSPNHPYQMILTQCHIQGILKQRSLWCSFQLSLRWRLYIRCGVSRLWKEIWW